MPDQQPRTKWQTFTSWHHEPSLYREMYTRTVAALAAALVIYVVAAVFGIVTGRLIPTLIILVIVFIAGQGVVTVRRLLRAQRLVKQGSPGSTRAELMVPVRIYRRSLVVTAVGLVSTSLLLWSWLATH